MTRIVEALPDEHEIDELTNPKGSQAATNLQQRRAVKRRLDDYFEQMQLRKALGLDD